VLPLHFVVVFVAALVFTILSVLGRRPGPIPPAVAFLSWIVMSYQSVAIELFHENALSGGMGSVIYEGARPLAMYFLMMAGICFLLLFYELYTYFKPKKGGEQ